MRQVARMTFVLAVVLTCAGAGCKANAQDAAATSPGQPETVAAPEPTPVPPTPPMPQQASSPPESAPVSAGSRSDAPANLPQAQAVAPSDKPHFQFPGPALDPIVFHTADERFTLRLGGQIQFRYQASDIDSPPDRNAFYMRQARPQIRGSLGAPWLTFFMQPELAGTAPKLLDLELTAQPIAEIGLKIGQFLTPFSRTFYTPVPKLLFPDFSIANEAFRADRDTGAMLFGAAAKGLLEYYAGVFNGNRIDKSSNDDADMMYVGRVAVNPLGPVSYDETPTLSGPSPFRLGLGLNAYRGEVTQTTTTDASTTPPTTTTSQDKNVTAGADIALHYWYATLQAEAYYRQAKPGTGGTLKSQGGYVHASTFLYPPYIELAARVSYVDPDKETGKDQTLAFEGLLNLYGLANNLKLNLRYTRFDNPSTSTGLADNVFTTQLQAFF